MKRAATLLLLSAAVCAFAAFDGGATSKATAGKVKKGKVPVTVTIKVPEGYHIYGPKSTDIGVATSIKVKGNDFKIASINYPKTTVFTAGGEKMDVYKGTVTVPLVVQPVKKLHGKQELHILVSTQACNDRTCLPPATEDLKITVNLG